MSVLLHAADKSKAAAQPAKAGTLNRPVPDLYAQPDDSSAPFCKATLVICPLVAVIQWRQEIARFTAPGSVKVCNLEHISRSWNFV